VNDNRNIPDKRRGLKVTRILILLLLICIGLYVYYRLNLKSNLQTRIDAIRSAGYPTNCIELDMWYKIPPNVENAAYTIQEALSLFKTWDKEKKESLPLIGNTGLPPRTVTLPADMKALIAEYVADNNEALELFHQAAGMEYCRYPINLSAGLATLLPYLSEMRNAVKLLGLEAVLYADNGNAPAATLSAISGFGIARSFVREPITVSQLVRCGCQNTAISTVEQVLNRVELTDKQLSELAECVRQSESISDISIAFAGERCMGIDFFNNPGIMNPSNVRINPIFSLYKAVGMAESDAVIYLDLMDGYMKCIRLPLHERRKAADTVGTKIKSISKARVLPRVIMPSLSGVIAQDLRTIAHLRTADAALAVQRYRLKADKCPDTLADLVPVYLKSVPKDPFDGNELRYKRLEAGFVVYSIGEDLSDDGGKERPTGKKNKGETWDVTFIVER
jgi:hypothetical protein